MDEKDCCYEEMSKKTGGQSMPSEIHDEPGENRYEESRKGYDKNGLDWSGMKGAK